MKNICIVDYDMSVIGGTERVAANLANKLAEYYHVHVVGVHPGTGKPAFELRDTVRYHTILQQEERLRTSVMRFQRPFIQYVNTYHIDVVLMIGDYVGIITVPTKVQTKAKYIFCEHGALMNQWKEKDITFIRWFSSLCADKVIALTKSTRDSYIQKFHLKPSKVGYIYNWIDPSVFSHTKAYDTASKRIISVGRFDQEKGQELLVQIARRVLPSHREWKWEVYGEGKTFSKIKALVKHYHLEKQLILKGNDLEVHKKYHRYALFVLTSHREGLPMVLLEAKANHLPMISFDIVTGPREIIHDGRDGFLVPPYEVDQMAERLSELMDNDEVRAEFAAYTDKDMYKFQQPSIIRQWRALIDA